jgi:hypothetical protein
MKRFDLPIAPRWAPVLAIAAVVLLAAAEPGPAPPLPGLNEKVLAFAQAKLGTSVGDGQCTSLAIAALRDAGARAYPMGERDGDFVWGEPIDSFKEALPGDILQFRNAVLKGNKPLSRGRRTSWHFEFPHHTAIVAAVSPGGTRITILHQNVTMGGKDKKDAKLVQETLLPIDSLQKGGWIHIFRPVAATGRRVGRGETTETEQQP